ncbi:MAG: hypothetical protein QNK04_09065 [Myxococcota bacterium]|nr:hypothetical protein [Myxococcota bacterium]
MSIDGQMVGFAKSVRGGHVRGELAKHDLGPSTYQKKHLATIEHAPIEIEVGMDSGPAL